MCVCVCECECVCLAGCVCTCVFVFVSFHVSQSADARLLLYVMNYLGRFLVDVTYIWPVCFVILELCQFGIARCQCLIHTHTNACMHLCTHTRTHVCTHSLTHTHTHTHTHMCTHTHTHTNTSMPTHTHMHMHTHTHTPNFIGSSVSHTLAIIINVT